MTFFQKNLKTALKERKITQTALAKALNVTHSTVWEWLNTKTPSLERFIEICNVLKLTPNELLAVNNDYTLSFSDVERGI